MDYAYHAHLTLERLLPRLEARFAREAQAQPVQWQTFLTRLQANFRTLFELTVRLYGGEYDYYYHLEELLAGMAQAWLARPAELKALDAEREAHPAWFQSNQMVGGVCYVDLFAGDLNGIRAKIPYFKEMGLTYLHLMPLFRGPDGPNDGGYAISSYREVNPALGTMEQLAALSTELRRNGISLVLDFVFNHTSDEHAWALKAKAGDPEYQAYYLIPRPPDARRLRENAARDLPRRAHWRLHLFPRNGQMGVDHFPFIPVGLELPQPHRLHPHGRRVALSGQCRGRGAAPRRGGVHLETAGHQLRELAGGPPPHPGVQRGGAHRCARPALQVRGHRPSR